VLGIVSRRYKLSLRRAHRAQDIRVASAAAKITGQVIPHFIVGWIRVFVEKCLYGEYKPWGAIGALQRSLFDEGILDEIERAAVAKGFQGRNLVFYRASCEKKTGTDRLPVAKHRATTAGPDTAALAHAPQLKLFAQYVQQGIGVVDG
jgi:hypothetical protein